MGGPYDYHTQVKSRSQKGPSEVKIRCQRIRNCWSSRMSFLAYDTRYFPACSLILANFFSCLIFGPKNEDLASVKRSKLLPDYAASHPIVTVLRNSDLVLTSTYSLLQWAISHNPQAYQCVEWFQWLHAVLNTVWTTHQEHICRLNKLSVDSNSSPDVPRNLNKFIFIMSTK
jgi:hypothetical protein